MESAVLLTTMRCNIRCAHCSVDSHPHRAERLDRARALALVDGLSQVPGLRYIDLTGGEPMLHADDVLAIASAARTRGKAVRLVSNGFWARTVERAREVLVALKDAGVTSVGLSIDEWHLPFIPPEVIHNYLAACRDVGLVPLLSCVVATSARDGAWPAKVVSLLERYGIDRQACVELYAWGQGRGREPGAEERDARAGVVLINWQFLTGEGRARELGVPTQPFTGAPDEPCRMAGRLPTIDEAGRLFPCCSPWISRKTHALADVTGEDVPAAIAAMQREPLVELIHRIGPRALLQELIRRGWDLRQDQSGICNQCGIMLDAVPLPVLRAVAAEVLRARTAAALGLGLGPQPAPSL